jgi:hypothetical protein
VGFAGCCPVRAHRACICAALINKILEVKASGVVRGLFPQHRIGRLRVCSMYLVLLAVLHQAIKNSVRYSADWRIAVREQAREPERTI